MINFSYFRTLQGLELKVCGLGLGLGLGPRGLGLGRGGLDYITAPRCNQLHHTTQT